MAALDDISFKEEKIYLEENNSPTNNVSSRITTVDASSQTNASRKTGRPSFLSPEEKALHKKRSEMISKRKSTLMRKIALFMRDTGLPALFLTKNNRGDWEMLGSSYLESKVQNAEPLIPSDDAMRIMQDPALKALSLQSSAVQQMVAHRSSLVQQMDAHHPSAVQQIDAHRPSAANKSDISHPSSGNLIRRFDDTQGCSMVYLSDPSPIHKKSRRTRAVFLEPSISALSASTQTFAAASELREETLHADVT